MSKAELKTQSGFIETPESDSLDAICISMWRTPSGAFAWREMRQRGSYVERARIHYHRRRSYRRTAIMLHLREPTGLYDAVPASLDEYDERMRRKKANQ